MDERPWRHHLRLLPGGDADLVSALVATGTLYAVFLFVGGILALVVHHRLPTVGPFTGIGLANAVPCAVIALWTGLRIRRSKHIALDEAAADLKARRVHYGDEVSRVPLTAIVVSTKPRQVTFPLADGRQLTLFYRVNDDADDVLALGWALARHRGLTLEDYVHQEVAAPAAEMLPDPAGIREALTERLLRRGIVITRIEAQ